MIYTLKNVHLSGNENKNLKKNIIYGELHNSNGELVLYGTLECILIHIRDLKLEIENVTTSVCESGSKVSLDYYNGIDELIW